MLLGELNDVLDRATLTLTVRGPDGAPLLGVQVVLGLIQEDALGRWVGPMMNMQLISDETGTVTSQPVRPATYRLRYHCIKPGYQPSFQVLHTYALKRGSNALNAELKLSGVVKAVLLDAQDAPLAGAKVEMVQEAVLKMRGKDNPAERILRSLQGQLSPENGAVRFECRGGEPFCLVVLRDGKALYTSKAFKLKDGETLDLQAIHTGLMQPEEPRASKDADGAQESPE